MRKSFYNNFVSTKTLISQKRIYQIKVSQQAYKEMRQQARLIS